MKNELAEKAAELPESPGVYIMKNKSGEEIYVGKAKSLKKRVSQYFAKSRKPDPKIDRLILEIDDFDIILTDSEVDALVLEAHLIKDLQPKYNSDLKNNDGYPFVEVDWAEDFPAPSIVYRKDHKKKKAVYVGPFTEVTALRAMLNHLQLIFKFCTCKRKISRKNKKIKFNRPCLNYHIGRCTAPCSGKIGFREYRNSIRKLLRFLAGKKKSLVKTLKKDMKKASENLEFETAAKIRDQIQALKSLDSIGSLGEIEEFIPLDLDYELGLKELGEILGMDCVPMTIEGIDISNLSGQETVGSLVTFAAGRPYKEGYRRYKIKGVKGIDDYSSIAEVVKRRYKRLKDEGGTFPDIILIDGGKGQLNVALKELRKIQVESSVVIGLAKEEEMIYHASLKQPISLARNSIALRILQQVRDEAHRFAQLYHHLLRKKKFFDK